MPGTKTKDSRIKEIAPGLDMVHSEIKSSGNGEYTQRVPMKKRDYDKVFMELYQGLCELLRPYNAKDSIKPHVDYRNDEDRNVSYMEVNVEGDMLLYNNRILAAVPNLIRSTCQMHEIGYTGPYGDLLYYSAKAHRDRTVWFPVWSSYDADSAKEKRDVRR